jgi:thiamine pyrophosphokinase
MNCIIVTGGELPDINIIKKYCSETDLVIGVDGTAGLFHMNNILPDVLIGDFDTADPNCVAELENAGVKTIRLLAEKNETDTEAALDHALHMGAKEITILGALGGRLDHTMSNIMMLVRAESRGAKCRIMDSSCEVYVSNDDILLSGYPGQTISILPLTGEVRVNASGLKYPLNDLLLKWGSSRGVSNVMLENDASISITGGYALIIKINIKVTFQQSR